MYAIIIYGTIQMYNNENDFMVYIKNITVNTKKTLINETIKKFMENGYNIESTNMDGDTVFTLIFKEMVKYINRQLGASLIYYKMARELIKYRPNINHQNKEGYTALLICINTIFIEWDIMEISGEDPIKFLIINKADVNRMTNCRNTSVMLHIKMMKGYLSENVLFKQNKILKLLLDNKGDANKKDHNKISPLMYMLDYPKGVKILLQYGAKPYTNDGTLIKMKRIDSIIEKHLILCDNICKLTKKYPKTNLKYKKSIKILMMISKTSHYTNMRNVIRYIIIPYLFI